MANKTFQASHILACAPLYPPVELMHATGFHPLVLWNLEDVVCNTSTADKHLQPFCCSVARRMVEYLLRPGNGEMAAFFSMNACDTIRNLPEIVLQGLEDSGRTLPMLHFHLPAARLCGANARRYLAWEINRIREELEGLAGAPCLHVRFQESVALYARFRTLLLALEDAVSDGGLPFHTYCRAALQASRQPVENAITLLEETWTESRQHPARERNRGVLLSGILPPPTEILRVMEGAGLRICANDIACLHRSIAYTPENFSDPVDYYQQFYEKHFPCPTLLHTADARCDTLMQLVEKSNAVAVVFIGEKFCEYEFFEIPYISKRLHEAGVATLALEFSEDGTSLEAQKTRIEALAEQLRHS